MLSGDCGSVGFPAGGDEITITGSSGRLTAEETEHDNRDWRKRNTKDACLNDPVFEITIPAARKNPKGNRDEE